MFWLKLYFVLYQDYVPGLGLGSCTPRVVLWGTVTSVSGGTFVRIVEEHKWTSWTKQTPTLSEIDYPVHKYHSYAGVFCFFSIIVFFRHLWQCSPSMHNQCLFVVNLCMKTMCLFTLWYLLSKFIQFSGLMLCKLCFLYKIRKHKWNVR